MNSMYRAIVASGDDADAPERVHVDHRGDRAVVTLDESDRLNVLSAPLVRQLRRALVALDADADVRTVVLTGADPGFSAGPDTKQTKLRVGVVPRINLRFGDGRFFGRRRSLARRIRNPHVTGNVRDLSWNGRGAGLGWSRRTTDRRRMI